MSWLKITLVAGGLAIIVIVSAVLFSYEKIGQKTKLKCDPSTQNCALLQAINDKDLHSCAKLSSEEARECERTIRKIVALDSLDPKNCDALDSLVEAEACKAEISFRKALTAGDKKMCEEIKLAELKTRCLSALSKIPTPESK